MLKYTKLGKYGHKNGQIKSLNVYCNALLFVSERSLAELQQRSECVQEQEFNYIVFKITVAEGIKKMYETYRDQQWTKLQEESTNMLQVLIDFLTLKAPITTAADNKFCDIFPNFGNN